MTVEQLHGASDLRYSEYIVGQGAELLAKACALGAEGIVSKLADAPYRPGRQKSWLKAKCPWLFT